MGAIRPTKDHSRGRQRQCHLDDRVRGCPPNFRLLPEGQPPAPLSCHAARRWPKTRPHGTAAQQHSQGARQPPQCRASQRHRGQHAGAKLQNQGVTHRRCWQSRALSRRARHTVPHRSNPARDVPPRWRGESHPGFHPARPCGSEHSGGEDGQYRLQSKPAACATRRHVRRVYATTALRTARWQPRAPANQGTHATNCERGCVARSALQHPAGRARSGGEDAANSCTDREASMCRVRICCT